MTLIGLMVSGAIGWAGLALWSPHAAHLTALPSMVKALPFDRRWWAIVLMLLGTAGVAAALPAPPWTMRSTRHHSPPPAEPKPPPERDEADMATPA